MVWFVRNGILDLKEKKMGFERTVDQNLPKKDGFDSNGVLDLREKKMGFERTVEQNLPKK